MKPCLSVVEHQLKFGKKTHLTGLILPDAHHAPKTDTQGGVDPYAWSVFMQAIPIIKPDFLINIGDFSECTSVNSYQWAKKKRPPMSYVQDELLKEFDASNKAMDLVDAAVGPKCQKIFLEGNHELWIDNLFVENPHTDPKFRPENGLNLDGRGYRYYEHGQWIKIGKCYYNHGTMAKGVNHNRSMLISHGKNMIYGHTHDLNAYAMPTLGGILKAYSCGFLGLADKDFLRGMPTNWEHGFMTVNLHKTGYFTPKQYSINYGTTWVHGKRIKA